MSDSQTGATEAWLTPSAALNRLEMGVHELGHVATAEHMTTEHEQLRHGVTIGPLSVLLPSDTVSEVVKGSTIYPIPKTADWVKGLLNLRGNLVAVFDLAEHLDSTATPPESPQILAVGKAEQALAFIVDGIPKLASTKQSTSHSTLPLPEVVRTHVRGAFVEDDHTWLEIDFPSLIESLTDQMED